MPKTRIGEKVAIDVFGLRRPGGSDWKNGIISGTIIALDPGTITVRVDDPEHTEVTVGPARVLS
jgi:hypothetical protein